MFPSVLFCFWLGYRKGEVMVKKTHKTPSWFNELLINQVVSKEILLHFKKHYLKPIGMEEENEGL